ncbi:hypothetical protein [Tardiphaga sp. P9-11]|uniref:hypothetical protein n=1 Tax=Tardiphaga sp. P9-11 TaxID=2024614 RepID=UPI0011F2CF44|nr:hypothetical protein [Tardiphaga sp. P9-11]KAA0069981.1 hypothetical protein CIW50_27830 [Tardiphaga sp. P9-11]
MAATDDLNRTGTARTSAISTTKILAIGTVTSRGDGAARASTMPLEIRETVRLHLEGYIEQWFSQTNAAGVVFILNMSDLETARALLTKLPLGRAGMMEFQLIPMGPLTPLKLLL